MIAEWGAGREFRDAARAVHAGRARDDHLHLGHDRRAEGRDADARQPGRQPDGGRRCARRARRTTSRCRSCRSATPSSGWSAYVYLLRGVTMIFAESFDTIGRDLPVVKPTVMTGVPRVYEKMHARISTKGRPGRRRRAAIFRWAIGVGMRARPRAARGQAPVAAARGAGGAGRPAGVREDPRRRRRTAPVSASRAARRCRCQHRGVLPRHRPADHRGLRPDRDRADPDRQSADGAARRHASARPSPSVELRIADDGEILARGPNIMAGYYNKPEATADGHQGRLVPHRRHRQHRRRRLPARSPTARRTCWSPPAARRSRRSRSRTPQAQPARRRSRASSATAASSPRR